MRVKGHNDNPSRDMSRSDELPTPHVSERSSSPTCDGEGEYVERLRAIIEEAQETMERYGLREHKFTPAGAIRALGEECERLRAELGLYKDWNKELVLERSRLCAVVEAAKEMRKYLCPPERECRHLDCAAARRFDEAVKGAEE